MKVGLDWLSLYFKHDLWNPVENLTNQCQSSNYKTDNKYGCSIGLFAKIEWKASYILRFAGVYSFYK